jgi:uncharacterized protein (DUF983 family)
MAFVDDLKFCIKPRCPVCRQGRLFKPMSVTVVDKCDHCGADLGLHDIGDGAAVFILFILCFSLIPLAWVMELIFAPPLFFHVLFSGVAGLAMIAVMLPATKAYIIMLEWRHLKHEADDPEQPAENGGNDTGGD